MQRIKHDFTSVSIEPTGVLIGLIAVYKKAPLQGLCTINIKSFLLQ